MVDAHGPSWSLPGRTLRRLRRTDTIPVEDPRLRLRARDLVFMAWPVLWLTYTMLRGAWVRPQFTGFGEAPRRYPYEFLDVDRVPLAEVVGSIAVISLLLVGIGAGYIALSRRLDGHEH